MIFPELWGVVNLTPDSFYAASRASVAEAVGRAAALITAGAQVVDAGAESTRPGALPVSAEQQLAILLPFIEGCAAAYGEEFLKKLSIDTRAAEVMAEVLKRGVGCINDVSGGTEEIYRLIGQSGSAYVLVHTQGSPDVMQKSPDYLDVVAEVENYLLERSEKMLSSGVAAAQIIWDTGIGFGKTVEHNLRLITAHPRLRSHGYRVLAGVSRKSFIGKILELNDPADRLTGTLAVQAYLTLRGCDILRVHDVKEMAQVLRMLAALEKQSEF